MWLQIGQAVRNFDILFIRSNCSALNREYVEAFGCPLRNESRNRGNYLSGYCVFKRNITKMMLEFRIQMPTMTTNNNNVTNVSRDLLKFRADGCHLATYKAPNPIVESIIKKLRGSGNFAGCPLKANFNYTVKYFALNPDYFPPITPEMTFSATMNMFSEKFHLLSGHVEARVVKKRGKSLKFLK
ncbi:uncharacterized protein LOC133321465 [Musca vetustissima]|uniref:uncharacterized protein LOC133321465 n=1 Tax=Musca vetustissima TaxID=27455 RepID=UPI002AB6597C|nr:uncharacterized protein LOC133321465 [Musca vetustissima]